MPVPGIPESVNVLVVHVPGRRFFDDLDVLLSLFVFYIDRKLLVCVVDFDVLLFELLFYEDVHLIHGQTSSLLNVTSSRTLKSP